MTVPPPAISTWVSRRLPTALLVTTSSALLSGVISWRFGTTEMAERFWTAAILVSLIPALWWVLAALRERRLGTDLIAVLALVGTLAVGEQLAGALIAVMLATGRTLDSAAERRATRDLRALTERSPHQARRFSIDGLETVSVDALQPGDRLVIGPGEVVPVDGLINSAAATLDESVLTGESVYAQRQSGDAVRSGSVNAGAALEMTASATAADSTYSGIVRLAQEAAAHNAPVVRLADRFAAWFLPLTLLIAGVAWLVGGSAERAVAVLVVATPCPLLLAAPVAIVSGLSRAARIGVIVRSGGALEKLGKTKTLILDKTGTVTTGHPVSTEIRSAPGWSADDVLRLAASADRFSPHVVAHAIVDTARRQHLHLSVPSDVTETAGTGTVATVDGARVTVGNHALPARRPDWADAALAHARLDGAVVAWVSVDDDLIGAILLNDPLRIDAPRTLRRLRAAGITRMVMLTGDRLAPAEHIAALLGLDHLSAEQTPADKVAGVRRERQDAVTAMIGDGVNDAPALAAADVGIALSGYASTASSEAADIVLATGRIDRLADAMLIARRSRTIAVQSAGVGMALSLMAMTVAAVGLLPAVYGALLQELIDVTVILNALRALRVRDLGSPALEPDTEVLLRRFSADHEQMRGGLTILRMAARRLLESTFTEALPLVREADAFVQKVILPHERAEDQTLYPALADPLGSAEATATMSRMHAEINYLARRLHAQLALGESTGGSAVQREDMISCLYGLHELLTLHFAAEEENYFTLLPPDPLAVPTTTQPGGDDLR